jgi:hypothetical protein
MMSGYFALRGGSMVALLSLPSWTAKALVSLMRLMVVTTLDERTGRDLIASSKKNVESRQPTIAAVLSERNDITHILTEPNKLQ